MTFGRGTLRSGALAEFATADEMIAAVRALRAAGYRAVEFFAPYDVVEARDLVPRPPHRLRWITAAVMLAGAVAGYLVQVYANVWQYPQNAGGRPFHAVPMFLIPSLATALLLGAVAVAAGLFIGLRLPELWHPLFEVSGFGRSGDDRFWVAIDGRDPRYHPVRSSEALTALRPERVVVIDEDS